MKFYEKFKSMQYILQLCGNFWMQFSRNQTSQIRRKNAN